MGEHDQGQEVLLVYDGSRLADYVRAVPPETTARARALFRSYGSCSTSEPIEDLAALSLLRSGFVEVTRT